MNTRRLLCGTLLVLVYFNTSLIAHCKSDILPFGRPLYLTIDNGITFWERMTFESNNSVSGSIYRLYEFDCIKNLVRLRASLDLLIFKDHNYQPTSNPAPSRWKSFAEEKNLPGHKDDDTIQLGETYCLLWKADRGL
jgi:hypothetical protein